MLTCWTKRQSMPCRVCFPLRRARVTSVMSTQLPLGATVKIETLEQAIDLFVTDGMPARNLAPQTRKNYRHDLLDLLAFCKDRGASTLAELSLRHLEAYQAGMDRRGYSASTRNRKTHSIKSLFHFLFRLGI